MSNETKTDLACDVTPKTLDEALVQIAGLRGLLASVEARDGVRSQVVSVRAALDKTWHWYMVVHDSGGKQSAADSVAVRMIHLLAACITATGSRGAVAGLDLAQRIVERQPVSAAGCSFCGIPSGEAFIVAGPGVFICDGCVAECARIITGADSVPARVDGPPPTPVDLDFVCDGPPGPEAGRFVEAEVAGRSVKAGEWIRRPDGLWALRVRAVLPCDPRPAGEGGPREDKPERGGRDITDPVHSDHCTADGCKYGDADCPVAHPPSVVCGTGKSDAPPDGFDGETCPKCSAKVIAGYGLAGGGIGAYWNCDACGWFGKEQDESPACPVAGKGI